MTGFFHPTGDYGDILKFFISNTLTVFHINKSLNLGIMKYSGARWDYLLDS
jgi:hypothetical protein